MESLDFLLIGEKPYREVWHLQHRLLELLKAGEVGQTIIICSHPLVITIGRRGGREHLLAKEETLRSRGIEVVEVERGGDITLHCPSQLVVYPLLNLASFRRDVGWYMRQLERAIIDTLAFFGIRGIQVQGKTGVWVSHCALESSIAKRGLSDNQDAKIASIGVKLSRWYSSHGLALNVGDCQSEFELIEGCGFKNLRVTSLAECTRSSLSTEEVVEPFIRSLCKVFEVDARTIDDRRCNSWRRLDRANAAQATNPIQQRDCSCGIPADREGSRPR